jgi:5-methylthioribose kinase
VLDPTTVLPYLRERGFVSDESVCRARELPGGVSSIVIQVKGPGSDLIVKQSLPRLRVAADWRAERERILTEAAGLELAAALTPGRAPRILDVDEARYTIAIECAPAGWDTWKQQLLEGTASTLVARGLGETLATWHRVTATDAQLRAPFADREVFLQLRVDPYYLTVAGRHRDLARRPTPRSFRPVPAALRMPGSPTSQSAGAPDRSRSVRPLARSGPRSGTGC